MVDRFQQQNLQSAQVGLPREDKTLSTSAALIAKAADAQRNARLDEASRQFSRAEAGFGQAVQSEAYYSAVLSQQRRAEQERLLQEKIATAKYGASATLREAFDELAAQHAGDPLAAVNQGKAQVDQILSGFVPKNVSEVEQSRYRTSLQVEKAQFLEKLSGWHREQEKTNSNNNFQLAVGASVASMQKANNVNDFLSSLNDFASFADATANTPERQLKVQEALSTGSHNFVLGIAQTNPSQIKDALAVAGPYLSNEQVGAAQEKAEARVKEIAAEALHKEQIKNNFDENVLAGKLTGMTKGALQKANTATPGPNDVSLLREASKDVVQTGNLFDAQIKTLEKQIKAQGDNPNPVLVQRHESLIKQKKQVETSAAQLSDKADAAAQTILKRNEMAIRRAEVQAHRQFAQAIATENRLARIDNASLRADLDAELAAIKGGGLPVGQPKIGVSKGYADVKNFPGLQVPGNLDLTHRQIVDNPDGSYGSELSISFNDGKHEVLIPTIFDGKHHTPEEAIEHYRKTGEHMGKFAPGDTKRIDDYAEKVHSREILVNGKPYHGPGDAEKLAAFSRAKLEDMQKTRAELAEVSDRLRANPGDKGLAAKASNLAARVSALAHATISADKAVEQIDQRSAALEKQNAKASAKLYQTAGVPLYTSLLQRAQTPFAIHTEKGKVKIDGVKLDDARQRLDQLDSALADMSQAEMLTKEQIQSVKSTIEDRRQKLNAWAQQDGWGSNLSNINPYIQDAYNAPISDLEKRGLALPGTAQHKKALDLYKANLDAIQAHAYQKYENPKQALLFLQSNAQALANQAMQATLQNKTMRF